MKKDYKDYKDYKITRLQDYKITRLQDYKDYKITKITRLQRLQDYKDYKITKIARLQNPAFSTSSLSHKTASHKLHIFTACFKGGAPLAVQFAPK